MRSCRGSVGASARWVRSSFSWAAIWSARRLELGGEVAVVVGDRPSQVGCTHAVEHAVRLHDSVDALVVAHVELYGTLFDCQAKDVGPRLEHRDVLLGLRDPGFELRLLGLGGRDLVRRRRLRRRAPLRAGHRAIESESRLGFVVVVSSASRRVRARRHVIAAAMAMSAMTAISACPLRLLMSSASQGNSQIQARLRVSAARRVRLEPSAGTRRAPGGQTVDCCSMSRSILQRRLVDVSERLKRIRAELGVTEEQLVFLEEEADDVRLRVPRRRDPAGRRRSPRCPPPRRRPGPSPRSRSARRCRSSRHEQDPLLDRISAELSAR